MKNKKEMLKPLISFDWAVKRLLRNKANFGILEGFLSELLMQDIKIERILESESNQENDSDKFNRVDILAEDSKKQLIIIELQNTRELDYFQRMLFGTSKVATEYINAGEEYMKVRKIYSVNIVYFDLGQGNDYIYHGITRFTGMHTHEELKLNARQRDLFLRSLAGELFPEYYVIKVNRFDNIAKDTLDEWIFYLKNGEIKEGSSARGLAEVEKKLKTDKLDKTQKAIYYRHLINISHQNSSFFTARYEGYADGKEAGIAVGIRKGQIRGRAEGKAIGIAEGKAEGKAEGLAEGKAEGKAEGLKEVARNLLAAGVSLEIISQTTGLSKPEIEKLTKKI